VSDHHHHHHDHSGPIAIGATATRVVIGLLTVIGAITLIATAVLWPERQNIEIPLPMQTAGGGAVETEAGTVVVADVGPCGSPSIGRVFADSPEAPRNTSYECERILIDIESGPHAGNRTLLEISPGPGQPSLVAGDEIRIVRQTDPYGTPMYSFDDYARGFPLALIAAVFFLVVIVVARWRGVRALLGLGFAFGVLVMFLLPALLDGKPAIPVALVSGSLILYAVLYLAHGVNLRTSSALLGTLTSMVVAAVLSWVAIEMTRLTGLSEEQNTNVATYIEHVSITGLLLAGFIIGSLGVLNDVTITQASAAFELAALDEQASRREIFAAAMRVGRDHIASTVYTLVLAYAGGALPLLLLFSVAGRSIRDVLVGDAVAIEIARSAVGGIALTLSVPLTTGIAVMLARPFGAGKAKAVAALGDSGPGGAAVANEGRAARRRAPGGAGKRGPGAAGPGAERGAVRRAGERAPGSGPVGRGGPSRRPSDPREIEKGGAAPDSGRAGFADSGRGDGGREFGGPEARAGGGRPGAAGIHPSGEWFGAADPAGPATSGGWFDEARPTESGRVPRDTSRPAGAWQADSRPVVDRPPRGGQPGAEPGWFGEQTAHEQDPYPGYGQDRHGQDPYGPGWGTVDPDDGYTRR